MLYAITTTGKVTLLIVAGLFIAWALITAIWIPKRNPDFPATLTAFLLVSVLFLAAQLGTVYWVTTTQEVETEATAPGESTPTETTPTESTSTGETTTGATTPAAGKGNPTAGKQVFETAGCKGCHTLADAGATGTVGPNLDDAKPSYDLVIERVTKGKGPMPPFKGQLTDRRSWTWPPTCRRSPARPRPSSRTGYPFSAAERCPSGLRSATGNRVSAERCFAGSNPALSASCAIRCLARPGTFSLPVVLDRARVALRCHVRVEVGATQRLPLAQQVPRLVELHLQVAQPLPRRVVQVAGRLALPELVLLGDELLDAIVDRGVVHLSSS